MTRYIYSIMPVSSDSEYGQKRVRLNDAARDFDLAVHFPLDRGLPKEGMEFDLAAASTDIRQSVMVIADLTFERPSCYYELGLAQALGARVSLIAKSGTPIHQAFGRNSVLEFRNLEDYTAVLGQILQTIQLDPAENLAIK
ncbi:hypothetical protein [Streptomyces phaeochromogenes]|uniref:hypothetical protein n=1 Tax=Streptomyces phaeochromogenes TaxID=1923 RepID=UPI00386CD1F6|nr:nucleoside 2-deoxyribosyltransferase [Streptomyces phaeochromogenes]